MTISLLERSVWAPGPAGWSDCACHCCVRGWVAFSHGAGWPNPTSRFAIPCANVGPSGGAKPQLSSPVGTCTHRYTHTQGQGMKSPGWWHVLLFSESPGLCRSCLSPSPALLPSKQPCPPQPPPRTDLDLNTIIHSSHKQLQRVAGHPRILFAALLQLTAHYGAAACEGKVSSIPFPNPWALSGHAQWCLHPVFDAHPTLTSAKICRVYGMWGCLFNDTKTITLLQPRGVLGKRMIPTLSCTEQTLSCLAVAIRSLFFPFSSPLALVSSCVVYKMNGALNEAIDRNSERLCLSVTKGWGGRVELLKYPDVLSVSYLNIRHSSDQLPI